MTSSTQISQILCTLVAHAFRIVMRAKGSFQTGRSSSPCPLHSLTAALNSLEGRVSLMGLVIALGVFNGVGGILAATRLSEADEAFKHSNIGVGLCLSQLQFNNPPNSLLPLVRNGDTGCCLCVRWSLHPTQEDPGGLVSRIRSTNVPPCGQGTKPLFRHAGGAGSTGSWEGRHNACRKDFVATKQNSIHAATSFRQAL